MCPRVRIAPQWIKAIGLDDANYGTHAMRRTKVTPIYRYTRNLRAVQLSVGQTARFAIQVLSEMTPWNLPRNWWNRPSGKWPGLAFQQSVSGHYPSFEESGS
jgi:hypothetical protein